MAKLEFNANDVEPKQAFEPVPAGKYLVAVNDSEMKRTKDNTGSYLKLTFQILEGEHKGRNLWVHLNLENASEKTVQIAKAELSAICRAVGVMIPRDSIELHNLPLLATVRLVKRKDSGELDNRISKYERREVQPAPAAQTPASAPWRR